jgi:hypothetical protein
MTHFLRFLPHRRWPLLFVVLALAGCGQRFAMGQVKGRITYQGKPLPEGTVMFVPQTGFAAAGGIRPDGTYRLLTKKPGDGAVVGHHKVCIKPPFRPETSGYPNYDKKYWDAETSGFEVDVKGGENEFDFDLPE